MRAPIHWLSDYVSPLPPVSELADALTLSGSKVELIDSLGADIERVVVGRILDITPHPNADRLSVCQVDAGHGPLTIVTGAPNVKKGDFVPVALDGAHLPGGKTIVTGELRGVRSEGMLCSLSELNLTHGDFPEAAEDGIFILPDGAPIGEDIRTYLQLRDDVLEFEITNNRPDCLSMTGIARECAATVGAPLTLPEPAVKEDGPDIDLSVSIDDTSLCARYMARVVTHVKIEPSPLWMRARLRAAGVRPINNIVDITNYVMLEWGQPMHAFDYACVREGMIIVRPARSDEVLETLDGKQRTLTPGMLLITDPQGPIAVAGVMGGANSEITSETKAIVFESANFNGPSVRKTALALGMRTDASSRFEKGLDPALAAVALERACELVEQLGAGTVCRGVIDEGLPLPEPRTLTLDPARINAHLGTALTKETMAESLRELGFTVENDCVTIPSWRNDIAIWQDLSEEVARLFGYNNIPSALSDGGAHRGQLSPRQKAERRVHAACRALGYCEMLTYSFAGTADYDALRLPADHPRRSSVVIENPLGEERALLRTTALPSLLTALARNQNVRNPSALLYELAMTYHPQAQKLPEETVHLILGGYGGIDFFSLKGAVETVLSTLRVDDAAWEACTDHPAFHPGQCARITVNGQYAGVMGQIHPLCVQNFDLDAPIFAAELDFTVLWAASGAEKPFRPMPRFPSVSRDLAVVCPRDVPAARLMEAIRAGAGELLVQCEVFDVYTGSQIPADKKSVAFALILRADDRTLTDEDADAAVQGALQRLETDTNAVLR